MRAEELLQRKLSRVKALYQRYGSFLSRDETLAHLLTRYLEAFEATEEVSRKMGLTSFCARCGQEGWGTCCGEDMEFHCEDVLLLANLLLGVSFPEKRFKARGCFFVGEKGCLLKVRPLICRNFICPELADFLGPQKVKAVQEALGPEAEALFLLCVHLRRLCPEL